MTATTATIAGHPRAFRLGSAARAVLLVACGVASWAATSGWQQDARVVVVVLVVATGAWLATRIDDAVVALVAVVALALSGALATDHLFASLGDATIWLLIGSCMLAGGLRAAGATERAAFALVGGAKTVRGLWYRTALALFLTTFAVPATSGRAALAMPVFQSVAAGLPRQHQRALSLLFPAVILLSAFASILGAGAHLIAAGLIEAATGVSISFVWWFVLGAPVALVTCVVATELTLTGMLSRDDRRTDLGNVRAALAAERDQHDGDRLRGVRSVVILVVAVALWLSEPLHGMEPALVALAAGVATIAPGVGVSTPRDAFSSVPWSLIVFLAATLALGGALIDTGAAARIAEVTLASLAGVPAAVVMVAIVSVSALAHLVVQSRSARSTVLLPIVLVVALGAGINPVAAALASTAAAGFCLTLTSSAKPVAMFQNVDGVATFRRSDLLALAAMVGPFVVATTLFAAVWLWPALGVPLAAPLTNP